VWGGWVVNAGRWRPVEVERRAISAKIPLTQAAVHMLELRAMATAEHFLDRYLDPLSDALSRQAAQKILDLEPEPEVVRHVEELAEKSDAGTINDEERDEYRALADAGTLVALLKAKARRVLKRDAG
jgi:hypothetical protein